MKRYFKSALIGFTIGLTLVSILFFELFYIAGEEIYITQISNFKNYQSINISLILFGITIAIIFRVVGDIYNNFNKTNKSPKEILMFYSKMIVMVFVLFAIFVIFEKMIFAYTTAVIIKILLFLNISVACFIISVISIILSIKNKK